MDATGDAGPDLKGWIAEFIAQVGPRWAGSPAEAMAAERIRAELAEFCDEARVDAFRAHPRFPETDAQILLVFYLASVVVFPFSRWGAFAIAAALLAWSVLDNILMVRLLDPILCPAGVVTNVIGVIRPSGEVRQRVIFSGHHDSPNFYPIWDRAHYRGWTRTVKGGFLLTCLYTLFTFLAALAPRLAGGRFHWWWAYGLVVLVVSPFLFRLSRLLVPQGPCLGANDNLSAVACAVAAGRAAAARRPRHTEVWVVSFGAEERGMKGSLAFGRRFRALPEPTYIVNMDLVGKGDEIVAVDKEPSTLVTSSPEVVDLIRAGARRAGKEIRPFVMRAGFTDSSALVRKGMKAASILVLDGRDEWPPLWHVEEDRPENLDESTLRDVTSILGGVLEELEARAALTTAASN